MSPYLQIAIALSSIAVLLGLMALVKYIARQNGWSAEVQRKLIHVATGLYALSLPWLFASKWPVYLLVAVSLSVLLVLRIPSIATSGLGAAIHSVERKSYGEIFFVISVGVTFFLSDGELVLFVLPIAVLTLADAAAALTGSAYGRKFFSVEQGKKSIEGTTIFFLIALVLAMFCLLILSDVPRANVVALSIAVAAFGTLIEAESWRGLDNFFVPIGLLLFLMENLTASLAELGLILGVLAFALCAFHWLGQRLGLKSHTVRVYVIAAFLIVSVAHLQNAVMPVLALGAHALAQSRAPAMADHPHLDMVAALGFVSIGWLSLGGAMAWNAIIFYGLTSMGLAMSLCVLAVSARPVISRLLVAIPIALSFLAMFVVLTRFNHPTTAWGTFEIPLAIASLLIVAIPAFLVPGFFIHSRVAKVTLLSLAVPLPAYMATALPGAWSI
ncbi:MAG: hypothetical protein AAGE80_12155 [Pseudomonadota bacterium]